MEQLKDHSKAVCVKFLVRYTFPLEIGAFKISICPKKMYYSAISNPIISAVSEAYVLSFSLSSERIEKPRVVCDLHTEKWSM